MTKFKHSWTILSRISLLCLLLFCAPTYADFRHINKWTTKEKTAFITYGSLVYVDIQQTRWALDHPCGCYAEGNPLLGSDPHTDKLYALSALSVVAVYTMIGANQPNKSLDPTWALSVVRLGVIIRNDRVGVSWQVAF